MSKNLDSFGVQLKQGKNLDLLRKAQNYFSSKKNVRIISYQYTTDSTKIRHFDSLRDSDLKRCAVCDKSLYYFENAEGEPKEVKVRQKKQIVLLDDQGHKHHCCYKFSSCLRNVNFGGDEVDHDIVTRVPTFLEFIDVDEDDLGGREDFVESAEKNYNRVVVPFVKKWQTREINKHNVMEFLDNVSFLEEHMIYYEDDVSKGKITEKILKMIGVKT